MNLAIRVDSSESIGTGHIVRCITLAKELRKLGLKVHFISKPHKGNILGVVKKNKFSLSKIKPELNIKKDIKETSKILKKYKINLLILDNYDLNLVWEKGIKKYLKKLIVISDLTKQNSCDILINSNFLQNKKKSLGKFYLKNRNINSRFLFGLRYAILNNEYQKIKQNIKIKKQLKRINIFFGGFKGSLNLLEDVVNVMSSKIFKKIKLDIISGLNQKISKRINLKLKLRGNFKIFQNLPNLANSFKNADLAIGCGGVANLERLCLGIPSLVFLAAKNQEILGNTLAKKNLIIKIKKKNNQIDKEHLFKLVSKFYKDKNLIKKFSEKTKLIVDGFGTKRIARTVVGFEKPDLKIRKVNKRDANILLDMANDKNVRQNAFNKRFINYGNHMQWFNKKLKNKNVHMYIAKDLNDLVIGQVRFDYVNIKKKYSVDISIDECARGYGIGKLLLKKAINKIPCNKLKSKNFFAQVLNKNIASHKLFLDCNFYKNKTNNKFTEYEYNIN